MKKDCKEFDLSKWIDGAKERDRIVESLSEDGQQRYLAICERHSETALQWALTQQPAQLAVAFANLWAEWAMTRRNERLLRHAFRVMSEMPDLEAELADRLEQKVRARRLGGFNRTRPTDSAKFRTQQLSDQALKEGWSASDLVKKLAREGFTIGSSTASSWLKQLREGKPLVG